MPSWSQGGGARGVQGEPQGAQDLILCDFGSILEPFGDKDREKRTSKKHSNRYHKKVVWRGRLSLKLAIPQTQGNKFGHGGGEAEGNWICMPVVGMGVVAVEPFGRS